MKRKPFKVDAIVLPGTHFSVTNYEDPEQTEQRLKSPYPHVDKKGAEMMAVAKIVLGSEAESLQAVKCHKGHENAPENRLYITGSGHARVSPTFIPTIRIARPKKGQRRVDLFLSKQLKPAYSLMLQGNYNPKTFTIDGAEIIESQSFEGL